MIQLILPVLAPIVSALVDRIPDPEARAKERARIEAELVAHANSVNLAQVELNKQEAAHGSIFVAGWRPFIGWICGVGLAWAFVLSPIAEWAVAIWAPGAKLPEARLDFLLELVLAMLGLGGLRTFEKMRGLTVNMPSSVDPATVARGRGGAALPVPPAMPGDWNARRDASG